jgi:hypothetical protein
LPKTKLRPEKNLFFRHSCLSRRGGGAGGNLFSLNKLWIPACAGMTKRVFF